MKAREEYLKEMRETIDRLQVKASLAKLELRDVRHDLGKKYDVVRDRLAEASEGAEDRWDALRQGLDAAWHSFKGRFDEVMAEHRGEGPSGSNES